LLTSQFEEMRDFFQKEKEKEKKKDYKYRQVEGRQLVPINISLVELVEQKRVLKKKIRREKKKKKRKKKIWTGINIFKEIEK